MTSRRTVIITETNVPHKDNIAYFGEGDDEAHMVYQFSLPPLVLHAVQKQNVEALCQWAQSLSLPSGKTTGLTSSPLTMASGWTHCGACYQKAKY